MTTSKPRSPLDRAAMKICRLANAQNDAATADLDRYWDSALSMRARAIYRAAALDVFRELAPEGVAPRKDGAEVPA